MNKFFIPAILTCFILLSAFTHFKTENKDLTEGYVYIPAATVNGVKTGPFYISSTEITNAQYKEFVHDLALRKEYVKERDAQVDTGAWRNFLSRNDKYADYYFQNPKFSNYPVVAISKTGAELYCAWLTEKYNSHAKKKVTFRLPTEAEWMLAAKGGDTSAIYPWKGNSLQCTTGKWKGEDMCNYKHDNALALTVVKGTGEIMITAPSQSYLPNKYGIYNMSGNVAEFVQEPGITKGGGWGSTAENVTIAAREKYPDKNGVSPNVGFRPVMVVGQ